MASEWAFGAVGCLGLPRARPELTLLGWGQAAMLEKESGISPVCQAEPPTGVQGLAGPFSSVTTELYGNRLAWTEMHPAQEAGRSKVQEVNPEF